MARRRKLVKAAEQPTDVPTPEQAPEPQEAPKEALAQPARRRLVKKGDHPAVAQFAGFPEAQARVREALEHCPRLEPTAFSWSPLRMGTPLCGAEAERVMGGKSIKVPGLVFMQSNEAICSACYVQEKRVGTRWPDKGFEVTLYEPRQPRKETARTCIVCGEEFHGEQGR